MTTILAPMTSSSTEPRVYSAAQVHAALPWPALAAALERAFIEHDQVPLRHSHGLGGRDTLLLMPAWNAQALGVKLVTVMPEARTTVQATYVLLDRATGAARAVLDGEALTVRRTAATSALAARRLAREDARTLLVIGTGRLAPWLVRAHVALRPDIEQVWVWGRRADAAQAMAQVLAGEGLPAQAVNDLPEAVGRAGIVCTATTATEPVLRGGWLKAGTHVDLVGSFRPDMREADDVALVRSRIVVDTYGGALSEAGELVQALEGGVISKAGVVAELGEVLRGDKPGRLAGADITIFKSVGSALEDLAAATLVMQPDATGARA
jgi:alanine dehydrogenase